MGEAGEGHAGPSACSGLRYRRREPERTLLHATVRAHLSTFLAQMEQRGDAAGLPGFVIPEFERYLACGIEAKAAELQSSPDKPTPRAAPDRLRRWTMACRT